MSDLVKSTTQAFSNHAARMNVHAVNGQTGPLTERREIEDSTAVAIANWWLDGKRRAFAALAAGQEVSIAALHDEIAQARADQELAPGSFDSIALDCLATWAVNHPSRKPDPRDPLTMLHALMALQATVPSLGWDFERYEDEVFYQRINVTISLTPEQGEFLRQGREMFAPKEN